MSTKPRFPAPVAEQWDWQLRAACRGRGSALFFHQDEPAGSLRVDHRAKALCATCPVRAECAVHALAAREPYGVWGGFTERERLRLLAVGWEDLADRRRGWVDVARLEARLTYGRELVTTEPSRRTGV